MATLFTIGHSTRSLDELIEALRAHGIRRLVDIRSFPMSRRLPHFNRENLEVELPKAEIDYVWMQALGGRRKKIRDDSPNTALRSPSFRNYADYMLTPEFRKAAAELVRMAEEKPTAYMCAERVYFRCHRMMVSDYLVAHGHSVLHIDAAGPTRPHKLLDVARIRDGELVYNGGELFPEEQVEQKKEKQKEKQEDKQK
ncbi:MAG: DUF488 domain-containing protein [Terriglobales bacterium]